MTIITVAIIITLFVVLFAGLMILGGNVAPEPVVVEWDAAKWVEQHDYKFRTASVSSK